MERSIPGRESNNNQNFWAKSALKTTNTHTPSWGNGQKEGESMNGKVDYSKC